MTIRKVVIPAAGLGTRLRPATRSQPKEMLPVARKPTIQYVVEEGVAAGLNAVLIITGARKRAIEDHFDRDHDADDDDGFGFAGGDAHFFYVRQNVQRGLADAVALAEQFVGGEPFVVALGDTIIGSDGGPSLVSRLMEAHAATGAAATIAVEEVPLETVRRYGIVQPRVGEPVTGPMVLAGLIEKPEPAEAPSTLAIASRYAFDPIIFEAIRAISPGKGGEYQLTDAIAWLITRGHKVVAVPLTAGEKRYDIGNFESYCKAFIEIALRDPELAAPLRAHLDELLRA